MQGLSRAALLKRYRRYSNLRKDIQMDALGHVSQSSFLGYAKQIGLSDGKVLFTDDEIELTLAYDLAVYTAPAGRSRAIDRCAKKRLSAVPLPDEMLVLRALQASQFSIFCVIGRCEPAGVLFEDLLRGGTVVVLDEGLEQSVEPHEIFVMRVAPFDGFAITCGAIVPINSEIFDAFADVLTADVSEAGLAALADDRRFAASLYQCAISFGMTDFVAYL
ncbi:MAG: hypothetical protein JWL86_5677 [Rhizobium sp.]|nr:hypothetical protein [Rhizobium sp.]